MDSQVEIISGYLHGKRLEKFLGSISVLKQSIALGSWIKRGQVQAQSGFYQGLVSSKKLNFQLPSTVDRDAHFKCLMCLSYGQAALVPYIVPQVDGVPDAVVTAWFELCREYSDVAKRLNAARPRPVVTPVGLSPKVTKTLLECELDIDLPSIRPADIEEYEVQARDKNGELVFRNEQPVMITQYRVKWSPNILHGASRFSQAADSCQACGKWIPSGMFVPVEAHCRRIGLVSLWLGCDCARNIFGIKDRGVTR